MRVAVYLPFLVSALLGPAVPWQGRRLPPAAATRLLVAGGVVCAASTTFALAALAFTHLGQDPVIAAFGGWSARALRVRDPVPAVTAEAAAGVLAVLGALAVRALVRHVTDLARCARACRALGPRGEGLAVLDDPVPDAYALPGPPGRGGGLVVVSAGMLRALRPDERQVLLAHERGHLRHRHHLYRGVASVAAAANPFLAALPRTVRHTTERWADEHAAACVGDRPLAARALARASLAAHEHEHPHPNERPQPNERSQPNAPGSRPHPYRRPGTLGFGCDGAAARVRSLLAPAPRPRPLATAALLAALVTCLLAANDARDDAQDLFVRAMHQPRTGGAAMAAVRAPDRARRGETPGPS